MLAPFFTKGQANGLRLALWVPALGWDEEMPFCRNQHESKELSKITATPSHRVYAVLGNFPIS